MLETPERDWDDMTPQRGELWRARDGFRVVYKIVEARSWTIVMVNTETGLKISVSPNQLARDFTRVSAPPIPAV